LAALLTCGFASIAVRGDDGEVDPLQCWWRTSVSAIRVGEPFTLVLTCAQLDTEAEGAIVDRARLDPRAIELPPFEVLSGRIAKDRRVGDRVFFQNEYTLRFVNDGFFDRDVPLPSLSIVYRLRSRAAGQDGSTAGMERRYAMPAESLRVTSLVPTGAADIRDASMTTFADLDTQASRGRLIATIGLGLGGLGVLVALAGIGRLVRGRPRLATAPVRVSDAAVLRAVSRELALIDRERQDEGWTPERAARVLAATRIIAEYAREGTASQRPFKGDTQGAAPAGYLRIRRFGRSGEAVVVSASVTANAMALEIDRGQGGTDRPRREAVRDALAILTPVVYAEETSASDATLDATLASMRELCRRLAVERTRLVRQCLSLWRRARNQRSAG